MSAGLRAGSALAHQHLSDAQSVSFVDRFAASRKDADQLLAADQDVLIRKRTRVVVEVLLIERQFDGEVRPRLDLGVSLWHWVLCRQSELGLSNGLLGLTVA